MYDIEQAPERWFTFDAEVVRDYNRVTEAARELDEGRRRKLFAHSDFTQADPKDAARGFRQKRHRLCEDDAIYFVANGKKVVRAGPVEASRVLYQHGVRAGIPEEFQPCREPERLCACCRLFGWIPPSRRERERADEESRAGFVSFSPARTAQPLTAADIEMAQATLRPLGQPHASAANFYLQQPGDATQAAHYDRPPFAARGRKFYWHGEGGRSSYLDTRAGGQPNPDNQNKTVELLKPECVFHFSVAFENLSAAQLGLLLVAVQPWLLGAHDFSQKLGLGKPLGLGSVEVRVSEVELVRHEERYESVWATGVEKIGNVRERTGAFVDAFVRETLKEQGLNVPAESEGVRQEFARLPHVEPLLWMLEGRRKPAGVRYPPGPAGKEEESFQWFMKFKDEPEGRLLTPQEIIGTTDKPKRQKLYPEKT